MTQYYCIMLYMYTLTKNNYATHDDDVDVDDDDDDDVDDDDDKISSGFNSCIV